MQILVLLGMYFDAVVVFVTSQTLLFRLALAILWSRYGLFEVIGNDLIKNNLSCLYRHVVTPMDLSTVQTSLENGNYDSLNDFVIDIRLIFKNSKGFNTNPMSRILSMTQKLEDFFEKRIDSLIHNDNLQNKAKKETKLLSNSKLKLAQKVENQEKIGRKRKCQLVKKTEKEDYKEFKLPYGWKKVGKCRKQKDPSLNCNWDFYVYSPDRQKFRSNVEIKNYLEKNPRVKCDLQVTSCSKTMLKSLTKLCETTLGDFELYL